MKKKNHKPNKQNLFVLENQASPSPQHITRIIKQQVVFRFDNGIPAFEDAKQFVLLYNEKLNPFLYLNSLDIEGLGFICVDPFLIYSGYTVNLTSENLVVLNLKDPGDALVLCFVTINKDTSLTTANLMAPIIMNIKNLKGCQIILEDYEVQYNIWQAISDNESDKKEDGYVSSDTEVG